MKGPCGCSLRKEEQSSGLWGLGVKQRNKISTELCGSFEVQQNVTSVVSPGRLQSLELASSRQSVSSSGFHHILQEPSLPSLNCLSSASFLFHLFFWALFVVQNKCSVMIGTIAALANNLVIINQNQYT